MNGFFRIITTVYNAEAWIGKCIKSVLNQTDTNWTQIIVVDGATDNTFEKAVEASEKDPRIKIVRFSTNKGICSSHIVAHNLSIRSTEDVFLHLDGDDFLIDNSVLSYIRQTYKNENVSATYGNYITKSGAKSICRPVDFSEGIRKQILKNWPFSHIRTFKATLWDDLKINQLKDCFGNFYTAAVDVAIFCPILEMCEKKIKFIEYPLYFYNDQNPYNEDKSKLKEQVRCALDIFSKKI